MAAWLLGCLCCVVWYMYYMGYGETRSDDAVEGGVGVRGWGGAVEEQGEGVRGRA